jgi:hypothetical protein
MSLGTKIELPPTGTHAAPNFADLQACHDWIRRLPLLNPGLAQAQLLEQLRVLNGYTLGGAAPISNASCVEVV